MKHPLSKYQLDRSEDDENQQPGLWLAQIFKIIVDMHTNDVRESVRE